MMADIFRMPRHNTKLGCCWACKVTPDTLKDFGSDAVWKLPASRLNHFDFAARLRSVGKDMSPLFGAPGVQTQIFKFDWLHAVDQGVCADFLGNLFCMFLQKEHVHGRKKQCLQLFEHIQAYYASEGIESRLPFLKPTMLMKKPSSSPKLRAKAAEARSLVRFAVLHSQTVLSDDSPLELAAKKAATHLSACYDCLSHDRFSISTLQHHATKFLLLYKALEDATAEQFWKIKPKFHLFAELCFEDSNPSQTWTYRDEDFGGYLASLARRRGGKYSPTAVASDVLNKFRAKELPVLRD